MTRLTRMLISMENLRAHMAETKVLLLNHLMKKSISYLWPVLIVGEVLMYGSYSILVNLSKENGQLTYLPSSFVLCTEIMKLIVCLVVLWPERKMTHRTIEVASSLPFAVPALCYAFNNNLAVYLQNHMDPATYMVLGNFKIVTTAAIYRVIFKKRLSLVQWLSLGLLTLGSILNSLVALKSQSMSSAEIHISWVGVGLLLVYCLVSGFSGVCTEYILKNDLQVSVYYQNAVLYMFGIFINLLLWVLQVFKQSAITKDSRYFFIFHGYSVFTWTLVITQAVTGLIMSFIMKHGSNILRIFVVSTAPLVTTILSHLLFNFHPGGMFILAFILVATAVWLYYM